MRLLSRLRWDKFVPFLAVLTLFVGGFLNAKFLTTSNMTFLIQSIGEIMLIAFSMTLLIIAGEIDLSVSSIAALSSCTLGFVWQHSGSIPLAVVSALVVSLVCGAFNGLLVTKLGLQSLAVTIGTLALYRGLCFALLGDDRLTPFPTSFTSLGFNGVLGTWLPYVTVLLVVFGLAFGVVLHATRRGRWVFAIGQSKDAARFVGIPVGRTVLALFVTNGFMAGVAGVVYTIRFASARPDGAVGLELEVIAAALFAGVSIFGGVGTMWAVAGSVVFLGAIRSLLRLNGATANELTIVTGSLLLVSVMVPAIATRISNRRHAHFAPPPTVVRGRPRASRRARRPERPGRAMKQRSTNHPPTTPISNVHTQERHMRKRVIRLAAAGVALVMLGACGSDKKSSSSGATTTGGGTATTTASGGGELKKGLKIAVIPKSINNAYFDAAFTGAKKACTELGATCEQVGPTQATGAAETEFINTEIQKGVDAIVISAADADSVTPSLQQAKAAGIKVVTYDADVNDTSARLAMIKPTTPDLIATSQVKWISDAIGPDGGEIAILSAAATAENQNVWIDLMKKDLAANYPKLKLVDTVYGDDDAAKPPTRPQPSCSPTRT